MKRVGGTAENGSGGATFFETAADSLPDPSRFGMRRRKNMTKRRISSCFAVDFAHLFAQLVEREKNVVDKCFQKWYNQGSLFRVLKTVG